MSSHYIISFSFAKGSYFDKYDPFFLAAARGERGLFIEWGSRPTKQNQADRIAASALVSASQNRQ